MGVVSIPRLGVLGSVKFRLVLVKLQRLVERLEALDSGVLGSIEPLHFSEKARDMSLGLSKK